MDYSSFPNTKLLNKLGIQLKDEDGNYRSIYDILNDLSDMWDKLNDKESKKVE